ncbi:glycosyltransferase family 2 protein [Candidatus Bathyarchaeota archaeon]|nr:glycosyltransferase family 2 protein [Candidatus Bathyarchaeota archaeon]
MVDNLKVAVGIPALNEEATIAKVVVHASRYAESVLVVDDGSSDDTGLIAERLGATVIRHDRNMGKGAALRSCFDWSRRVGADVLVTLDADGQHNPDEIPNLISLILKGEADVVIGSRKILSEAPFYRHAGGRLLDRLTGVKVGGRFVDAQSGFRAYSKATLNRVTAAECGMGVDSEILMRARDAGLRIAEVPAKVSYRGADLSTYTPVYHALDVLFSVLKFGSIRHPLLVYGVFSVIMVVVAVEFGIQTLDYYARWGRVITNLALISVAAGILAFLSFFTGIILFTLITVIREKK